MFENHHAGFEYIKKLLASQYKISMVTELNKGRHLLIQAKKDGLDKYFYFYCLFKHTTLHSFNFLFKDFVNEFPHFEGHGESINVEFLEYARRREATLLYIYPDGKVYSVESNAVFKLCNTYHLVRVQNRSNEYIEAYTSHKEVINEKEYVFPIKLMARFY